MVMRMQSVARALSRDAFAGLFLLLALSIPARSPAESIDACGVIQRAGPCLVFSVYSADYPYQCLLPDTVHLALGTECRLRGTFQDCMPPCGSSPPTKCLTEVQISACIPETLGCGIVSLLDAEYGCYLWRSLTHPENEFFLDDHDGYASGDIAFATGIVVRIYGDICLSGDPVLLHDTLSPCPDTLATTARVTWGKIKSGFR